MYEAGLSELARNIKFHSALFSYSRARIAVIEEIIVLQILIICEIQ